MLCQSVAMAQAQNPNPPADDTQSAAQTVVVTASLKAQSQAAAPAFITVLKAEDLTRSSYHSLADLLRETAGVVNLTDGSGREEIQIRGLSGKYTLLLVNGRRVSSSGALWRGGDFDLSAFPLNSIQRVEVVRGPMAALYGSDAMGGVVNIITKTPGPEWQNTLSAEVRKVTKGEQGDLWRLGFSGSGALNDKLGLTVIAEMQDRQPWYVTTATDNNRAPGLEEKQALNLHSLLRWTLTESQSLEFTAAHNRDKRPYGLYDVSFYPAYNFTSRDYREQKISRNTAGVTHLADWGWLNTSASISREEASVDDYNSRYNKPQQRTEKEINTLVNLLANSRWQQHEFSAGADWREQVIKDPATYLQTGKVSTRNNAVFLQDEVQIAQGWRLSLAGRYDHASTFGNHFSPKLYLVAQPVSGLTIKGGISEAFKAPDPYQLSPEYSVVSCGGRCMLTGNPLLKPEISRNSELGFVLNGQQWELSAVAFQNRIQDMINAYYDAAAAKRRWVNIEQAKTRGLELEGKWRLAPELEVRGNYTRLIADGTDYSGKTSTLEGRPDHMLHLNLLWQISAPLSASFAAHYTGRQVYETQQLGGYTRFDTGVQYRYSKALQFRGGIRNIGNIRPDEKNSAYPGTELARSVYAGMNWQF
jgi:outer membrane receptor for ferrienterochelin and colicins